MDVRPRPTVAQTGSSRPGEGMTDAERMAQFANQRQDEMTGRAEARNRYTRTLTGGQFSDDSYERAQQERNFHQTADFKKYFGQLDPASQLAESLGNAAYHNRKGLLGDENESASIIRRQGGEALGQGTKKIREGANSRGLLYSGMRQGAETDLRGKVANTMASQIQESNSDLMKRADSMDQIATQAKLQGAEKSFQSQLMIDQITQQNQVARAQQMQQLAGMAGYAFGRYMGRKDEDKGVGTAAAMSGGLGG